MTTKPIAIKRTPEPEEPVAAHPPERFYSIVREGVGWRVAFHDAPPAEMARYQTKAFEPDLKGLAMDRIMRDIEERSR